MNNVNQVTISGRLTSDAQLRDANNSRVAVIRIASNRSYKKGEEWVEEATFIDCEAWNKLADVVGVLKKGAEVMVIGSLASDDWEKDGVKRSKTKVRAHVVEQIVRAPRKGGSPGTADEQPRTFAKTSKPSKSTEEDYTLEIPF